ncbi:hypothetical protein JX266_001443 [Neoarthrinium moseri]|nr:hypothetical protein JX266_001443 [Neoarthrinium moseri]
MAKPKQAGNVPNRPLYSRISYLYQAASYLSGTHQGEQIQAPAQCTGAADGLTTGLQEDKTKSPGNAILMQSASRRLLTDMRSTSLKAQIRLTSAVKQKVCRYCDTLMVEGETCTSVVENKSKGGMKPWADVLVITCKTCGGLKRFPINAPRQGRRSLRAASHQKPQETPPADCQSTG